MSASTPTQEPLPMEASVAEPDLHAETLQQLKAARQWLKVLVDEFELEPEETAFVVNVVSPIGEREAARVTLAHSLAQIDACLDRHAEPDPSHPGADRHEG